MKSYISQFLIKLTLSSLSAIAVMITFASASANDGKPSSVAVKGGVPVNYYQAFMIAVAVIYGVYLIVRARRRKRNGKITE